MSRQDWMNKEMETYLLSDKKSIQKKTFLYKLKELKDYLFNKSVPENIDDIKDSSKILVIEKEDTFWEKLKKIILKTPIGRFIMKKWKEYHQKKQEEEPFF